MKNTHNGARIDSFWSLTMVTAGVQAGKHHNPWNRSKRIGQIRIRMYMRAGRRDYGSPVWS